MISKLYQQWNIQPSNIHGNCFTGYEPVYDQLDKFTNEVYDKDPTGTIDQVKEVADAGMNMPPKSTWVEPKLRSGLTIYQLHA